VKGSLIKCHVVGSREGGYRVFRDLPAFSITKEGFSGVWCVLSRILARCAAGKELPGSKRGIEELARPVLIKSASVLEQIEAVQSDPSRWHGGGPEVQPDKKNARSVIPRTCSD
jgi:hypothetical protein